MARAPRGSSNWAGYVVNGRAAKTQFERVIGGWAQPRATCSAGQQSYSAFWVGLGGYQASSSKLEQTGTEADCDATGHAYYSAWYELVPNPPVPIRLAIKPGDVVAASVTVSANSVSLHLRNVTTGRLFTKRLALRSPDTSSAEWIAEAPSSCDRSDCRTLPLTNFGSVSFSGASALATDGHAGSISDAAWTAIEIEIEGDLEAFSAATGPVFAGATPGGLSSSGGSFSVNWQQTAGPAPPAAPTIGPSAGA